MEKQGIGKFTAHFVSKEINITLIHSSMACDVAIEQQ